MARKSTVSLNPDALREAATRRNQSLDDLARVLGISDRHFYRILAGDVVPSPRTRANICRELGLRFEDIFEIRSELPKAPS
jgi:transcriptional regulator with XRE-family HTH domain